MTKSLPQNSHPAAHFHQPFLPPTSHRPPHLATAQKATNQHHPHQQRDLTGSQPSLLRALRAHAHRTRGRGLPSSPLQHAPPGRTADLLPLCHCGALHSRPSPRPMVAGKVCSTPGPGWLAGGQDAHLSHRGRPVKLPPSKTDLHRVTRPSKAKQQSEASSERATGQDVVLDGVTLVFLARSLTRPSTRSPARPRARSPRRARGRDSSVWPVARVTPWWFGRLLLCPAVLW